MENVATTPAAASSAAPATGTSADDDLNEGFLPQPGEDNDAPAGDVDENGDPIPAVDDDSEEFEHEGAKYKLPKALTPFVQKGLDYEKSASELANERRTLAEQHASEIEQTRAHLKSVAHLISLDERIAQFEQIDWDAFFETDPQRAQSYTKEFREAQRAREALAGKIKADEQTRVQSANTEMAAQRKAARDELSKPVDQGGIGWTPELHKELVQFGAKTYGAKPEEVAAITSPAFFKMLHDAKAWRAHQSAEAVKAKAAAKVKAAEAVAPAPTVNGNKTAAAARKNPDDMSMDEWVEHERARVAKKNKR